MSVTKIAALLRPSTRAMHTSIQNEIVELLSEAKTDTLTRQEIAAELRKPINCITAPVRALMDAGLIIEHSQVRNPDTGCLNWALKLKEQE